MASSTTMNISTLICAIIVALLIKTNEISAASQTYDSTCSCLSLNGSVCMHYSCKTTVSISCFASVSRVELPDGSSKSVSHLQIGDRVRVNKNHTYEPVIAFIHAKQHGLFDFLQITTRSLLSNSTSVLLVSPDHLVFDFDSNIARFAGKFLVGDRLQFIENEQTVPGEIISIKLIKAQGYYAPLTPSGTIVVDGVVSSNYATVSNHALAHFFMGAYRWWVNVVGSPSPSEKVHWLVDVMQYIEGMIRWCGAEIWSGYEVYDGVFQVSSIVM
ncbi:unnamed protein product [Adineta ricciae]|uniref:Uncharacterized protein n=1 Tax=Adineta ricciae TaxID=249248 RepID=A0A814YXR2_ADIRI|nr:unnamed protein product [Adineta ricciae]CAF1290664.1 unnamed protein product [Adineta ricciae]